jgi:carbamoyl-phosphate synthase large subunit
MIVIEMNPRVSRSSALASKATGFPIAKIATKLAVGYTLDEIPNDITRETPACFEPTIDYVVTKVPRFAFEKFPGADSTLGPQMKSVGEVMAIGRTFKESFGKALRSLEIGRWGFDLDTEKLSLDELKRLIQAPGPDRLWQLAEAIRAGLSLDEAFALTAIDPWFLEQMQQMIDEDEAARKDGPNGLKDPVALERRKRLGMSTAASRSWPAVARRTCARPACATASAPCYKRVDTCAAEFEARTPYLYSTYETGTVEERAPENEAPRHRQEEDHHPGRRAQPHRPGHRVRLLLRARGDGPARGGLRDHHGQLQPGDGLHRLRHLRPPVLRAAHPRGRAGDRRRRAPEGVIVQFGGQTPLRLAVPLQKAGVKLLGTSADAIDRAEDRQRFGELVQQAGLRSPVWGTAHGLAEARKIAERIGYPVMVPPLVRAGRAGHGDRLRRERARALRDEGLRGLPPRVAGRRRATAGTRRRPILIDQFLRDAIEVDVDVVADGHDQVIGGVMEHIEEAGIHSGDSACALPPFTVAARHRRGHQDPGPGPGQGAGRARPDERAVRRSPATAAASSCWR